MQSAPRSRSGRCWRWRYRAVISESPDLVRMPEHDRPFLLCALLSLRNSRYVLLRPEKHCRSKERERANPKSRVATRRLVGSRPQAIGSTITFWALLALALSRSNFRVSGFGSNARTRPAFPTLRAAFIEK